MSKKKEQLWVVCWRFKTGITGHGSPISYEAAKAAAEYGLKDEELKKLMTHWIEAYNPQKHG